MDIPPSSEREQNALPTFLFLLQITPFFQFIFITRSYQYRIKIIALILDLHVFSILDRVKLMFRCGTHVECTCNAF